MLFHVRRKVKCDLFTLTVLLGLVRLTIPRVLVPAFLVSYDTCSPTVGGGGRWRQDQWQRKTEAVDDDGRHWATLDGGGRGEWTFGSGGGAMAAAAVARGGILYAL